jgi:hypothetical protein
MSSRRPRARAVTPPDIPAVLERADVGDLDDDVRLDEVAIGAGVDLGRTVRGLTIVRSTVTGARLTGATLDGVELVDVVFEDCDLSGTTLADAVLRRVAFRRCRLSGVVAADLAATDVRVADCRADEIWLRASRLERCAFVDCDLSGSDWYGARVSHSRITGSRLDGSELSAAVFDDVALHGSSLEGVHGAGALRNVVIGSDQVVDVALPVLAALGIRVDDSAADELDAEHDGDEDGSGGRPRR